MDGRVRKYYTITDGGLEVLKRARGRIIALLGEMLDEDE